MRLGPDELEKQAGDGAVVVMEDHIPVGQRLYGAAVEDRPFGVMADSSRSSSLAEAPSGRRGRVRAQSRLT